MIIEQFGKESYYITANLTTMIWLKNLVSNFVSKRTQ